jgi:hypothetical protein
MAEGPELENFLGRTPACSIDARRRSKARTTSSRRCRNLTPAENRYDEEKALLGFFTSALSAVESFYFCAYFAAGW